MRIVGLDVGCNCAVLCCLDEFPSNIQRYFRKHRKEFIKLKCDRTGVDKLLSYFPDGLVLEPSGHWYAHFWYKVAVENAIKVFWVGHCDLDAQRRSYGFTNKRDDEDALCLAATYFDNRFIDIQGYPRFLHYYNDDVISALRETFLAKEQLQKIRSGLIAQLRQRLSYEFPELAKKALNISPVRGFTPVIGWLAEIHQDTRYSRLWKTSVAHSLNITLSGYTRSHAKNIVDIEKRITNHYEQLAVILTDTRFKAYHRVFDKFGFGLDTRSLLLFHIYPFEKFLIDGKRWVEYEESKGKLQKRDRSLRKFQAFIGLTYKIKQSGDSISRSFGGSSMVRCHLYMWCVCQITPTKYGYKVDTPQGRHLSGRYRELRNEKKVKGKDAITRILFKATRMLYFELASELID